MVNLMCDVDCVHLTAAAIIGQYGSVWAQNASFPQINDRYEFPLEFDLDRDNGKYLSQEADRRVRNLYMLHSCIAALLGAQVVLTHLPDRLKLLKKNFETNLYGDVRGSANVNELTWGDDLDPDFTNPFPDYVIYGVGGITIKKTGQTLIFGIDKEQ